MYNDVRAFNQTNSSIPDPFDFKALMAKGASSLTKQQIKALKEFTENYNQASYDASATLAQVQAAIESWGWQVNQGDPTFFRRFVQKYDMNYDGRLNPREFILASIYNNPQTLGSSECQYCYQDVVKTLDAIFLYLDCDSDGLVSPEDLWNNLPSIKRKTAKWNMFAFGNDQNIRTAAVNDFVLKNGKTKEGFITRNEFRSGLLLGFWDRQTSTTKIFEKEERTMKKLRWEEGDMIDIALFNYYKKKMSAGPVK